MHQNTKPESTGIERSRLRRHLQTLMHEQQALQGQLRAIEKGKPTGLGDKGGKWGKWHVIARLHSVDK